MNVMHGLRRAISINPGGLATIFDGRERTRAPRQLRRASKRSWRPSALCNSPAPATSLSPTCSMLGTYRSSGRIIRRSQRLQRH